MKASVERRILGDALDDTSPIVNYGPTEIDFDINMGFVQPIWLCIDTRRWSDFGSRECGQLGRPEEVFGKDLMDEIMYEYESGVRSGVLAKKYNISQCSITRHAKKRGISRHRWGGNRHTLYRED